MWDEEDDRADFRPLRQGESRPIMFGERDITPAARSAFLSAELALAWPTKATGQVSRVKNDQPKRARVAAWARIMFIQIGIVSCCWPGELGANAHRTNKPA